jgi:sugar diacid utilization regulator
VDALRRSAHVAALHLLHQRAAADLARVVRGEHLRSLLEGRGPVESVAAELGIDPQSEFELLAFTLATEDPDALEAARDVAATLIPLHFEFVRQCSASVVIGDVIYALFPDKHEPSAQPLETAATEVVERLEHLLPVRVTVAVGSRADLYALSESRRMVDTTLRALEPMPHIRVARTVDLRNQVLLLEIGEILKRWPELFDEKVEVLAAYDESRGTEYVRTLRAYLDAFGDVALAADCLGVHPNTFRYRLHRILELADLDLDDPDERLAVEIGLRFR